MKRTLRTGIIVCLFSLYSTFTSCFKTGTTTLEFYDIDLFLYSYDGTQYLEADTSCKRSELNIYVQLRDFFISAANTPTQANCCYAFQYFRYFDILNRMEDIEIYLKNENGDSSDITASCDFYYINEELQDNKLELFDQPEQLVLRCNAYMDSCLTTAINYPRVRFLIRTEQEISDSIRHHFVVKIGMDDRTMLARTEGLWVTE